MTSFCPYCRLVVAPQDPERRIIPGGAVAHQPCINNYRNDGAIQDSLRRAQAEAVKRRYH